jgi:hypothetical protein
LVDGSIVIKGRFISVSSLKESSFLACSDASFSLCRAVLSFLRSMPVSF